VLTKKKIGVLMGGISAEREVSLRSGAAIFKALKRLGYNAVTVDVGHDLCEVLRREKIAGAFLALHGGYGENGSIQGMLEVLGIPYTGSGVLASALAMDKEASKKIFLYHKITVPPFIVLNKEDKTETVAFTLPWVVKPAAEGSSIGVSIVREKEQLQEALEKAYAHGPRLIIEEFIDGKEIHIGILNEKALGGVEVRPSLEFYNYEAKYTAGLTQYILPPETDETTYERSKNVALSAHTTLGCKGATRVDLMLDRKGVPHVLEVNTIPGMTETSLLPKIAKNAGIGFGELLIKILGDIG